MSIAPHSGIVDFGTFTSPAGPTDGIQGEVPAPLAVQNGYVLTTDGWVPASSLGLVNYQGTWNASTNTPTLVSSVGVAGSYYVVSVAGNTNLNGITSWFVGDWAIFNGTIWQKVNGTMLGTMAYQNANAVAITGGTINGTTIGDTTPAAITGTTIGIDTSGTNAEIAPNTGITGWNYSGLSHSISAQESAPTGLFLSPDGLNMYVNGSTGDDVNQYTLSTAWNVSTATYLQLFSTAAQDSSPQDIFFKPDGLSMYIMGATNDTVFQYTLSSAFDISTASYASKSFSVTSQETSPLGLWFKPDGTAMYVIGSNTDTVFQYTLSTAWDVSTASYASISFNVTTQDSSPNQVNLSADGLTMWILGQSGDDITQYALGTAFNVSTAVFVNNFYIGFEDTTPSGLFIDSTTNNRVYMVGSTNDTVFQYNTATNSISAVTDVFNTTSNARIQGNLAVQGDENIDGALTAQGSLTTASNITASGTISVAASATFSTTTGNIAIGNSQTSGSWTAGGASGTGTITVGQSTVNQTTNIQAGATASGSTKAMNIGTAGLSGSTTNINIGSSVSGALGTTTIQAPTVNIGQTVTQFQVTNTASAVNYLQTTGSLSGFGAKLLAAGTAADIPLVLQPKGTGALQAQQTDSTATGGNARGANAVDWQTLRDTAAKVASATNSVIGGGQSNSASVQSATVSGGQFNLASQFASTVAGGNSNAASGPYSIIGGGALNTSAGYYNFIGGGLTNSGTSGSAVTTQSGTMNATTAVTLSGSNANIKVGQFITGTSIANNTYVAAISGTSLTLSQAASGSSTSTLSFYTPHGVVVGGGNNQATGVYSAILGGGDAGTAANRNRASGDYSTVGGGRNNTASGSGSTIGGGGYYAGITGTAPNSATGDGTFIGGGGSNNAAAFATAVIGGFGNNASNTYAVVGAGSSNGATGTYSSIFGGNGNTASNLYTSIVGGQSNTAAGIYNFIGGGFTNSGTALAAVTTQSATMNGTAAVTLAASNASIKVGQYISGTSIAGDTYVAAISGTSLTLSKIASGSSTSTLSFFTPHGVVVGGGNNQATGSYSFIGGGGDGGTAANRNVASGDWSAVVGGRNNTASGIGSFVGGGGLNLNGTAAANTASGNYAFVGAGRFNVASGTDSMALGYNSQSNGNQTFVVGNAGSARAISGIAVFTGCSNPLNGANGTTQSALLVLARETTNATATVLTSDTTAASGTNQVILPNNSAYYFKGSVIANVTGAASGAAWSFEGAIMRGATAGSTVLIGTPVLNRIAVSSGASLWSVALTADTTNGGLAVTVTGVASTTIRWVAKLETTEVAY